MTSVVVSWAGGEVDWREVQIGVVGLLYQWTGRWLKYEA